MTLSGARGPGPGGDKLNVKILLIRLSAIGDVVRTLPAFTCLRRGFPDARIEWAVEEASAQVLRDQPGLDRIVVFPRRQLSRTLFAPDELPAAGRALAAFLRELRAARYDLVIDFQGTFKSGLMSRLTQAPRRVGLGRGQAREMSNIFYTETASLPRRKMNRVDRALALVAHLGVSIDNPTSDIPERPDDAAYVERFLAGISPRSVAGAPAVIFPGTSLTQAYKRYPASHFAQAADRIAQSSGAPIVVAWGPGEEELAGDVIASMRTPASLAPAMSLGQLTALIRRCRVFVSSDTGPMHIAWTVGAPVVAVLGPTDPVLNHPGGTLGEVAYKKIWCSPCRNRGCSSRSCLEELPPETVAEAALTVIRRAESRQAPLEGRPRALTPDAPRHETMGPGSRPRDGAF